MSYKGTKKKTTRQREPVEVIFAVQELARRRLETQNLGIQLRTCKGGMVNSCRIGDTLWWRVSLALALLTNVINRHPQSEQHHALGEWGEGGGGGGREGRVKRGRG